MKRLLFALLMCVFAFPVLAQDMKQADQAFFKGKYDDAKKLYETTASLIKDKNERDKVYALAKKCTECQKKLNEANKLYKDHFYSKSLRLYKELLALNPKDPTAKSRVNTIPDLIQREKEDDLLWENTNALASLEGYNDYLTRFPDGKHKKDAAAAIKDIKEQMRQKEQAEAERLRQIELADAAEREREAAARAAEEESYQYFAKNRTINNGLSYLSSYPDGSYVSEVKDILVDLYCETHDYNKANEYAESNAKRTYIQRHQSQFQKSVTAKREKAAYQRFQQNPSESVALGFLDKYKDGIYAEQVSEWLVKELCKNNNFADAKKYAISSASKDYIHAAEDDNAYRKLLQYHTPNREQEYLNAFPKGRHYEEVVDMYVRDQIELNNFDAAKRYAHTSEQLSSVSKAKEEYMYKHFKSSPSLYSAQNYLDHYPGGVYQNEIREWYVKAACNAGDYTAARKYAALDESLVQYVSAEQSAREKEMRKREREMEFEGLPRHYIDATIGMSILNEASDMVPVGIMYSYVPQRFGFYLSGTYDFWGARERFTAVAGPVLRLLKYNGVMDMHLYAGIGYASSPSLVTDAGFRIGFSKTKFSLVNFNVGALYYDKTLVPYVGANILISLSIAAIPLLL